MRGTKMKLNYKRTIFVGFAFFLICTFWQAYDTIIPKILTDKFGMRQADSVHNCRNACRRNRIHRLIFC